MRPRIVARTILLGVLLATAGMTRLAAQQPGAPAPVMESTSLSGPRLRAEWPRFEPAVAERSAVLASALTENRRLLTTLVFVLVGVIVWLVVM
jgi:hypothetical protein